MAKSKRPAKLAKEVVTEVKQDSKKSIKLNEEERVALIDANHRRENGNLKMKLAEQSLQNKRLMVENLMQLVKVADNHLKDAERDKKAAEAHFFKLSKELLDKYGCPKQPIADGYHEQGC